MWLPRDDESGAKLNLPMPIRASAARVPAFSHDQQSGVYCPECSSNQASVDARAAGQYVPMRHRARDPRRALTIELALRKRPE
jgi:hypothetical protein